MLIEVVTYLSFFEGLTYPSFSEVFIAIWNYGIAECLPLVIMAVFLLLVARKDLVVIISRKVMNLFCVAVVKDLILLLKGKSILFKMESYRIDSL